jgi:hypothetical protein
MCGYVIVSECDFVAHLHFVEQPVRITLEYLGEMDANVTCGLAKAIHDSAQRRFVNAQHSCQTVLPDARGVHPQLQVRVYISIQGQGLLSSLNWLRLPAMSGRSQLLNSDDAFCLPNLKSLHVNILLRLSG